MRLKFASHVTAQRLAKRLRSEKQMTLPAIVAELAARGNPRIEGAHARVYVQPSTCQPGRTPKFQIYFLPDRPLAWERARDDLSAFARITSNGGDEGMLLMDRLPSPEEGEIIRARIGAAKRLSDEALKALIAQWCGKL